MASKPLHSENTVLDELKPWREEVIYGQPAR